MISFSHRNYLDALDRAAEALARQAAEQGGHLHDWLQYRLQARHGVLVLHAHVGTAEKAGSHRRYDALTRTLYVAPQLSPMQQAFQLATQLALLEFDSLLERELQSVPWQDEATRRLARMGLANYVAGAFVLPYGEFLRAAEGLRYDIDLLARHFGVGFETVCHRLSTLQRSDAPGVPFSLSEWTGLAISASASRPRIFISPRQAAPARCGWCTRLLPSRVA